jgi:hypothetical protein
MSTPVDPAVADAAIRAQLGQHAQAMAPPAVAAPGQADLASRQAMSADAAELLARLQALEAKAAAAEKAAAPPEPEVDNALHVDSNAPGWLHALVAKIEERLTAVEGSHADAKPEAGVLREDAQGTIRQS